MEVAPFFVDFHHFLSIFTIFYRFSRFTHFCRDLHFVAIYALFPQFFLAKIAITAISHVFCMYAPAKRIFSIERKYLIASKCAQQYHSFLLPHYFPQMHRLFLWKKYIILPSILFWTHESKSHIMSPFFSFMPFAINLVVNNCECKIHILP